MKKTLLFLFILTIGFSNAQNIFRDDFSTYTTNAQLSGQGVWTNVSSPTSGGLGACSGFGCLNARVLANPISYLNFGASTNSFELKPDVDGCGRSFTAVASGDLFFGMVFNLSLATATTSNDFFRVASGGQFNTTFKVYVRSSGSGYVIGISKGASTTISFSTNVLPYNQSNLVVVKYSLIAANASDDILALFTNPVYTTTEPLVGDVSISTGADQTGGIDRMTFRQNTASGIPTGRVGLVSVARTWADLTFQPLSTTAFSQSTFKINSFKAGNGILEINSKVTLNKATLNIYSILGTLVQSKKVDLEQNSNQISINAITNSAAYIFEIIAENGSRFSQKILVN